MDFSIIIPHKNSSQLLKRLLLSIPKRACFQVIVVDDNSSKDEYDIVQSYSSDFNFRLCNNEGMGAGGARNTGLKYAKGKWIIFADADDFFLPEFYDIISDFIEDNSDVIYFNVTSCYSDTLEPAHRSDHINNLFKTYNLTNDENIFRCRFTPPWGKMVKRSLIQKEQIMFEECPAGNDNWFSVNVGLKANTIKHINQCIYCVTLSAGSITTTLSKEKFESRFYSTLRTNKFLRMHRMNKYQLSLLYFYGRAHQFGILYPIKLLLQSIKYGANPFVGIGKLLHFKKYLNNRESMTLKQ